MQNAQLKNQIKSLSILALKLNSMKNESNYNFSFTIFSKFYSFS